jgi:hypothetical protein
MQGAGSAGIGDAQYPRQKKFILTPLSLCPSPTESLKISDGNGLDIKIYDLKIANQQFF